MDVIKTRLMAQNKAAALAAGKEPEYRGLLHALVKIPKEEGLRALWKGLLLLLGCGRKRRRRALSPKQQRPSRALALVLDRRLDRRRD